MMKTSLSNFLWHATFWTVPSVNTALQGIFVPQNTKIQHVNQLSEVRVLQIKVNHSVETAVTKAHSVFCAIVIPVTIRPCNRATRIVKTISIFVQPYTCLLRLVRHVLWVSVGFFFHVLFNYHYSTYKIYYGKILRALRICSRFYYDTRRCRPQPLYGMHSNQHAHRKTTLSRQRCWMWRVPVALLIQINIFISQHITFA